MKTKDIKKKSKHTNKPLEYGEACQRYAKWAETEMTRLGQLSAFVPMPNGGLSMLVGTTWHLRNVNGPLAKVGANGRIWRPSKLDW